MNPVTRHPPTAPRLDLFATTATPGKAASFRDPAAHESAVLALECPSAEGTRASGENDKPTDAAGIAQRFTAGVAGRPVEPTTHVEPSARPSPASARGGKLSPEFALTCALPDEEHPFGKAACDAECALDPVRGAVGLLGALCRYVAETDDRPPVLTPFVRESLVLNVIHKARTDPGFRCALGQWVTIRPAFDLADRAGELDVDRPDSAVTTLPDVRFLGRLLDLFDLWPVIDDIRALTLEGRGLISDDCDEVPERERHSAEHVRRWEGRGGPPDWPADWTGQ